MLDIGPSPAATLLRHMDTDEFELMNSKTLPRRLGSQLSHPGTAAIGHPVHEPVAAAISTESARPLKQLQPSRPMTLPTRGAAAQRVRRAEQQSGVERQNDENRNSLLGTSEPCESPSYMTHASYKFPEPQETNALPLPSREGKKQVKTNAKRHVRKYPLIIPANGVQRTLSKLTDFGEESGNRNGDVSSQHQQQNQSSSSRSIEVVAAVRTSSVRRRCSETREYENMPALSGGANAHTYQNLDKLVAADAAGLTDSASLQFESILESDMSKEGGVLQSPDVTDGFYNFSIQKEHYHKSKDVGFEPAQISGGSYVNDDELRNLDKPLASSSSSSLATMDSPAVPHEMAPTAASAVAAAAAAAANAAATVTTTDASQDSSRRLGAADNELAGNALFKKVRASVNMAMNRNSINGNDGNSAVTAEPKTQTEAEYFAATAARLADSNSVSCEDLLEFSDKKPRGCERGVDSDEVRIMVKVLGKDSTPTRCLGALEFINWDVHKSIKLIKLQNILADANLSLSAAFEALQQQEWDLHTTAVKLKGVKL